MKPGSYRVCPACGARNKAGWELCVRCGESLKDVALGAPEKPRPSGAETSPREGTGLSAGALVATAVVVVIAASVALWSYRRFGREAPKRVDPGFFTMPTLAPSPPAALPSVDSQRPGWAAFEKGRAAMAAGDFRAAVAFLAEAVAADSSYPEYRFSYATALWGADARDEALNQFRAAVGLAPEQPSYRLEYGRCLEVAGRLADAADQLEAVIARSPQDAQTIRLLSRVYERSGRFADALPLMRRLAAQEPHDVSILNGIGQALQKTGDLAGAAEQYGVVLERMPGAVVTRGLLAEVLVQQGKTGEAVALYREGIKLDPAQPILHRSYGGFLERTGNVAEAIAEYREYARLAPNAPDAAELAQRAERLAKRLESPAPS